MNTKKENEVTLDIIHILTNLGEFGYEMVGIKYVYISCSSHVTIKASLRGIDIKMDSSQLEQHAKGNKTALDVFAYYNNKCYLLLF